MTYQKILDKLEDIYEESSIEFLGTNEADLDFRQKASAWMESLLSEKDAEINILHGLIAGLKEDLRHCRESKSNITIK